MRFQESRRLCQDELGQLSRVISLFQAAIEQGLELLADLGLDARVDIDEFFVGQVVTNLVGGSLDVAAPFRQNWFAGSEVGFNVGGRPGVGEAGPNIFNALTTESHVAPEIRNGI